MSAYLQTSVVVEREQADAVGDVFLHCGSLSITVENASSMDQFDAALPGDPEWQIQKVTAMFSGDQAADSLRNKIDQLLIDNHIICSSLSLQELEEQDWQRTWLDQFKPIAVSESLWVCPSWCEPIDEKAINLIIDPGLAFGTGTHETTWLCLAEIAKQGDGNKFKNKSVIDFGAGSGILAIAAAKYGASEVFAIDVDEKAVLACTENIQRNGVTEQVTSLHNRGFSARKADVVIGNILAPTLIELSDEITAMVSNHQGALLMLSGILHHQADAVAGAYSEFQFTYQQKGDWMLLCGTRVQ